MRPRLLRPRWFFAAFAGGLIILANLAAADVGVSAATVPAASLQEMLERVVAATLSRVSSEKLLPEEFAVTLVDLRRPTAALVANVRGDVSIYPASVVKLFYLAATHRWLEDGKLSDTPELRRALKDMIVDSSNDATSYVVDLLTKTTSGPELSSTDLRTWFEQRNAVNRYFAGLGYLGINANKKPWGDGPYGRETQASAEFEPRRNLLTTNATARLLSEIALRQCVSARRSDEMLALLSRDPFKPSTNPDDQATFSGPSLPLGSKLWSKAGWTSQVRHDAAIVELPNGARFVLVVFTTNHVAQPEIIRFVMRNVVTALSAP